MAPEEERSIERWARSRMAVGIPSEIERRVLLESPRARQPDALERFWRSGFGVLVRMILIVSAIFGAAAVLSSPELGFMRRGFDPNVAIRVSAVCFALSVVFVLALLAEWWQGGRERPRGAFGVALIVLLPAAVTLLVVHGQTEVDVPWAWMAPAWLAAAFSGVLLMFLVMASQPAAASADAPVLDIATLTPGEVEELLSIREQTLRILMDRERIAPDVVEQARQVPLGQLHTLDDQKEKGAR